jgi:hypothetical protein
MDGVPYMNGRSEVIQDNACVSAVMWKDIWVAVKVIVGVKVMRMIAIYMGKEIL